MAIVGGGAAGIGGAAFAHVVAALCDRAGSESWLRGAYGPQFFNITVYTSLLYAAIGGGAAPKKPAAALAGALAPILAIALPMIVLTRVPSLQIPEGYTRTPVWVTIVTFLYMLGIWGAIAAIGAFATRTTRLRGAAAAVLGSLVSYGFLTAFLKLAPSYAKSPWNPTGLIPSPINLLDGLLSGACLCLALSLDETFRRKTA